MRNDRQIYFSGNFTSSRRVFTRRKSKVEVFCENFAMIGIPTVFVAVVVAIAKYVG